MKTNVKKMIITALLIAFSIIIPSAFGLGSAVGFLLAFPDPIIAARAATHMAVGYVGARLVLKNFSYVSVMSITAPIHGLLEALVVYGMTKNLFLAFVVVGVGTILHHIADSLITAPLIATLSRVLKIDLKSIGEKSKNLVA